MLYFKHSELAQEYHVSLKTVYNWIESAKQGKIDLELFEQDGRTHIANKQSNVVVLRQLSQEGKKYRNARFHKVVTPKPEFYKLYNRQQILDIITNLRAHGEIPRQYGYFDGGAGGWDVVMQRHEKEEGLNNMLKGTQELLHTNLGAIDRLIEGYDRINVVDIGPGNAMPVRELLEHVVECGVLHRYVAVDISEEMLRIAEHNIREWFGDKVPFEGHIRDIRYERFNDVLVDDLLDREADRTLNLLLFLGDTPVNFRTFSDPLRTIYGSMDAGALLVCTNKPDTETARRYFEFNTSPGANKLSPGHRLVLELLNVDSELYDVEMGFDERRMMRHVRVRLNTAITIRFQFEDSMHDVNLEKDSTILLLRVWHNAALTLIDKYQNVGLELLHSSMTRDKNYILTVFGMKEIETTL
jgi:SAM-dependent methyltransferase